MGAAASKKAATAATSAAAKATSTAAKAPVAPAGAAVAGTAPPRVVQTKLSREDIVGVAAASSAKRASAADAVRNPKAAAPHDHIVEMNQDLLREMDQFQGFEKVSFLEQDQSGFRNTASSYRARSNEPISLPTDRTNNVASGSGVYEKMEGRVTNRDMRFLLRLHYEDPGKWDIEALAAHFDLDAKVLKNVLVHVGPPNVLKPLGPSEHPLGIWYDSPEAAAALIAEFEAPAALPASSSSSSTA